MRSATTSRRSSLARRSARRWVIGPLTGSLAVALALATASAPARAGRLGMHTGAGAFGVPVTSLKEARYKTTVPQQYDFSCGSAATATLLTYQYGLEISEAEVFMAMYRHGDQAKIRREGFSLLDIQRYLASLGFQANGFELPLDKLLEEGLPAIVLLNDEGYRHFVVVKGMRQGRILIGDPARGTRSLTRERFHELWDNGVLFVIHNQRDLVSFNSARDWRIAPVAPLRTGVSREGLHNIVIPKLGPGEF